MRDTGITIYLSDALVAQTPPDELRRMINRLKGDISKPANYNALLRDIQEHDAALAGLPSRSEAKVGRPDGGEAGE